MSKRLRAVVPVKRIAPLLFLLCVFPFFADAQLLSRKVDLKVVDRPLFEIIRQLESDLQVQFAFNSSIIPRNHLLSVDLIATPLNEVLDYILGGLNIGYREMNGQLVLFKQAQPRPRSDLPVVVHHEDIPVKKKNVTAIVEKKEIPDLKPEENEVVETVPILDEEIVQDSMPMFVQLTEADVDNDTLLEVVDTLSFGLDTLAVLVNDTIKPDSLPKADTVSKTIQVPKNTIKLLYSNSFVVSSFVRNNAGEGGQVSVDAEKAWEVLVSPSLSLGFKRNFGHAYVVAGLQISLIKDQNRFTSEGLIRRLEKEVETDVMVPEIVPVEDGWELKHFSYYIYEPASNENVLQVYDERVIQYRYDTVFVKKTVTVNKFVDDTVQAPVDLELTRIRAFFTLPVAVGYEHYWSDKIYFGCNTGLEVSWLVNYVEESSNGSRYASVEDYSKIVFEATAATEIGYCFNTDFSAVLACGFKKQINSLYVNSFHVSRKNSSIGLTLGLQYSF